jgi:hypothetical protein
MAKKKVENKTNNLIPNQKNLKNNNQMTCDEGCTTWPWKILSEMYK